MIDINRSTTDIHYRYKMPRLSVKYEGKQTGVKTILINIEDISSSLKRNPLHILKFISYELATQTKVDKKRYIVNGKHEVKRLQDVIFDFIDSFVLCIKCENPETFYIEEEGLVKECLACGYKSRMQNNKLTSIILKDLDTDFGASLYMGFTKGDDIDFNLEEELKEISSELLYDHLKSRNIKDEEMIQKILSLDENNIFLCKDLLHKINTKTILTSLEAFIEDNSKYTLIAPYLKFLEDSGIKKNEIFKFYTKPQSSRKRSLDFKKEVNKYFSK